MEYWSGGVLERWSRGLVRVCCEIDCSLVLVLVLVLVLDLDI
jgi:hypothetical protein